jgi:hypothetical protein
MQMSEGNLPSDSYKYGCDMKTSLGYPVWAYSSVG